MTLPPAHAPPASGKSNLPWLAAIAVAAVVAYLPLLHAGWIWDDNHYVTDNIHLHTLHGLWQLWSHPGAVPQYYPLTHTTFWIEYHLWKLHPLGYHLDNLLLHIANAALVGLILRRLNVPGYALAAAIFAVHPVHVESVAWITERKNVLSGFLYLSALWLALDIWKISDVSFFSSSDKTLLYLFCLLLFILSLLSKSVTASFPAVLLLLMVWKRRRISIDQIISLLPFFTAGAVMGAMTSWMEHHIVGATGPEWNWTIAERILIAGRAVWFYLAKLVWPHPLIFIYHLWAIDSASPLQWLFPASLLAALIGLAILARRTSAPLVAALFFLMTLFPALGFVSVYPMRYSFVADHFQYLASIGPIALIGAFLARHGRPIVPPLLLLLTLLTWRQTEPYKNSQALWHDVIAKNPQSVIGHCNLGMALYDAGDTRDAAIELQRALTLNPHFVEAWIGLGLVSQRQGQFPQAMEYFRAGAVVAPNSPLPYWRMGLLHRLEGNSTAAQSEFLEAAEYLPNPAPAYEQLGEMDLKLDNVPAATDEFLGALKDDPNLVDAYNNLAAIALGDDRLPLAETECAAALAIDPDNATAANNMGIVYARTGRADQAARMFRKALEIDPDFQMARENLSKLGPP